MCLGSGSAFRFYDAELRLRGAAPPAILRCLSLAYGGFRANGRQGPASQVVEATFRSLPGGDSACALVFGDENKWVLPPMAGEELAELLVRQTLAQVCSHLLIHAGAVSRRGRCILLAGRSGSGKTTLTLALLERGFAFLSDETAAVARKTGRVVPFWRRPRVHGAGPQALPQCSGVQGWQMPGQSLPIGHLFVLDPTVEDEIAGARPVVVLCDRMPPGLLAELDAHFHVDALPRRGQSAPPGFIVTGPPDPAWFAQVERLCRTYRCTIVDVVETTGQPDFAQAPRLQPCPASQAALALLAHLQNGFRSRLFRLVLGRNPALLYTEMARTLAGVVCYRLRPGFLRPTVDLICDAVEQSSG